MHSRVQGGEADETREQNLASVIELVGAELLAAADLADLEYRLEMLLQNEQLHRKLVKLRKLMDSNDLVAAVISDELPCLPEGDELAPILRDVGRLTSAGASAFLEFILWLRRAEQNEADLSLGLRLAEVFRRVGESDARGAYEVLIDAQIPLAVRRGLLGRDGSEVCAAAFCSFVGDVESWRVMFLAERWRDGLRDYVRMLAGFPGVDLHPEELRKLGVNEVACLAAELEQHERAQKAWRQISEHARVRGLDCFPPGNDDD